MLSLALALVIAQTPADPALAAASREDRDGWIVVHLKGSPHTVGYQQGALLAPEIHETRETLAALLGERGGHDWRWYRETTHRLFWDKLEPEYRREIEGIADGVRAKGGSEDADDILAMNAHIEVSGYYLPMIQARQRGEPPKSDAPMACSAFVATGSATRDGKVVMGHNFWWGYLTGERWQVLLDIKPEKGHRVVMDSLPGLIHSGTDWAMNDAGILLCETTISDFTGFDEGGLPEFQRMRKAAQYSENLDDAARIFQTGNNGGYANTWLMADINTGEIGKLELGLKNVTFERLKDGYFVGSNFPSNPKLIAEEARTYRPEGNICELRRLRWIKFLDGTKGQVDAELGKQFLADTWNEKTQKNDGQGGALCGKGLLGGAVNAKVTTADMARKLSFWARMGVPDGSAFVAQRLRGTMPEVKALTHLRDMPGQKWMLFEAPK